MTSDVANTAIPDSRSSHKAARTALIAFLLLATMVWIGIAVGANKGAPGIVGLAATIFGGLSAAVLTAAIGGWIALKLAAPDPISPAPAAPASPELAPALAELDRLQQPIVRGMVERAAWRMPVFASIGIVVWCVLVLAGFAGGVVDFALFLLVGGLIGYALSRREAGRLHKEAYTSRAVDLVAQGAGNLGWRKPTLELARLRTLGLLPPGAAATSEGEIAGVHAGVTLRIAPARAPAPSGTDKATGFSGVLVELEAPGVNAAAMEQLAQMNPAVITQIDQIATLPGLGKPRCAFADGRLTLAIPETLTPRVFDAPAGANQTAAAARLSRIRQVIGAVQQVAEALATPPSHA